MFPFLVFHNRRQLKHITDKDHLHAAERCVRLIPYHSQQGVNRIHCIGPHHRDLVYDEGVETLDDITFDAGQFGFCKELILVIYIGISTAPNRFVSRDISAEG
ncbi:hypothetical protein D3C80_1887020 [compost metagenome]